MRVWSRSGTSMIGKPERFGVRTPWLVRQSRMRRVWRYTVARRAAPRRSLTSKPASTVARGATRDGPEDRDGGAGALRRPLTSGGEAPHPRQDQDALAKPPA